MINGNPYIARKFLDINFEYAFVTVDAVSGVSRSKSLHGQGDHKFVGGFDITNLVKSTIGSKGMDRIFSPICLPMEIMFEIVTDI